MSTLAIMAILAVVGTIVNAGVSSYQQSKEFQQQEDLLQQQMNFQAEREDINWQRQRPQQAFQDYLDAGFNPNLAAQAVMGGNMENAAPGSSPAAPSTNSAIGALSSMFGNSQQQLEDVFLKNAQIENIQSQTNKTDIEAGILPRDYQLRMLSTTKQLQVWDKSVEKMASEIHLNEQQTDLVKQQNLYYGRMSEAQIKTYQAQTAQALQAVRESWAKIEQMEHQNANIDADTALKNVQRGEVVQHTSQMIIEGDYSFQKSERERIAKEFEQKMSGVPLSADAQRYVQGLIKDGKFDEVADFYHCIYTSALSQGVGETLSSPKFSLKTPFFNYGSQKTPLNSLMFNPYFNPTVGASGSW